MTTGRGPLAMNPIHVPGHPYCEAAARSSEAEGGKSESGCPSATAEPHHVRPCRATDRAVLRQGFPQVFRPCFLLVTPDCASRAGGASVSLSALSYIGRKGGGVECRPLWRQSSKWSAPRPRVYPSPPRPHAAAVYPRRLRIGRASRNLHDTPCRRTI